MMAEKAALRLLKFLSAGESRSGESIARRLGCSRTAVWKHVGILRELGVAVQAEPGKGYRLVEPIELLEAERVRAGLGPDAVRHLSALHVLPSVDSTSAWLQRLPAGRQHAVAVFAERQTAGRGRRGRRWFSPFGGNVYLSVGWRFEAGAAALGCLPLVIAIAACRALSRRGLAGHGIKWPNDVVCGGRKLGGCLVELQGDAAGPCIAVSGIGLNVRMARGAGASEAIDQPWCDLREALPDVSRNAVAAALLEDILLALVAFQEEGFPPFRPEWEALDRLRGSHVELRLPGGSVVGTARGIGPGGGLRIATARGEEEHFAGEVSVRAAGE